MKALLYHGNAQLEVGDAPVPTLAPGEALVRVSLAGICGSDVGAWQGGFGARIKPPVTLGHEFVGEVAEIRVGERPSLFKVGDRIVGEPIISCGQCPDCRTGNYNVCKNIKAYGIDTNGCFAQYVLVPLERLHHVPEDLPTEKAVLCEPLAVAVHMRRVAGIEAHHRVAIFGAGPIGQLVGIACRDAGVTQLAAVDINPYRLELARESGMTPFNAAEDGFKEGLADFFQGRGADVSFEVAAAESTMQAALEITGIRGTILMGGFFKKPPTTDLRQVIVKELSVRGSRMYNFLDFDRTLRLLREKPLGVERLVSSALPLDRAVRDGFERIKANANVMKILIKPGE